VAGKHGPRDGCRASRPDEGNGRRLPITGPAGAQAAVGFGRDGHAVQRPVEDLFWYFAGRLQRRDGLSSPWDQKLPERLSGRRRTISLDAPAPAGRAPAARPRHADATPTPTPTPTPNTNAHTHPAPTPDPHAHAGPNPDADTTGFPAAGRHNDERGYVRDGAYANTDLSADPTLVRQEGADGQTREIYLTFDLSKINRRSTRAKLPAWSAA